MRSHIYVTFLTFFFIEFAYSAKIAVFVAPLSNSQVVFNIRFAEELAVDHEVVLIRPRINPWADKLVSSHPRVREIKVHGCSEETFTAYSEAQKPAIYSSPTFGEILRISASYKTIFMEVCANMANNSSFMEKLCEEKFDFAFTHHLDYCSIGIFHAAGIPQWGWILSIPPSSSLLYRVGMPFLPSINPGLLLDAPQRMNFVQRLKNFLADIFFEFYFKTMGTAHHTKTLREAFGQHFPDVYELMNKASIMVVNSNADIEFPIPVTSKVVFIGGLAKQQKIQPLPEPFATFIKQAKKVVLFSFGTVAPSSNLPEHWREAFLRLFRANPDVSFIWKMEVDIEVPSNVLRVQWQPQSDILANDKVVAFITHAGYNSIGESIASATPILTVPLFGDQFKNSQLAVFRKFGVRVDKHELSFDTLNEGLHKLLDDPKYLAAAREVQSIQNASPPPSGIVLRASVNFTLNHPHFDRELPRLPMYQLYSLDCMVVIVSSLIITLYILYRILRLVARLFWSMVNRNKVKQD